MPSPFNLKDNGLDCAISAAHPLEQCMTNYRNYLSVLEYYFSIAQYLLFKLLQIPAQGITSLRTEGKGRLFTPNELFLHFSLP